MRENWYSGILTMSDTSRPVQPQKMARQHGTSDFCTIHLAKIKVLINCTCWFVSDLDRNPKDRFSRDEAHVIVCLEICFG